MAKAFIDDANLTNIGNAIRNQNGTTTTYLPSEMADAINALPVLDTSDGTATGGDIVDGVTAYVNGEKIIGNIPYSSVSVRTSVEPSICSYGEDKTLYLCLQYPSTGQKRVIGNGKLFDLSRPLSDFGDATSEDVAFGKRYTSANGFNVQGTVSKVESGDFLTLSNGVAARESDTLRTSATLDKDKLMRAGSKVVINTDLSRFGDAKAADVAAGKTFTSSAGLKITGTSSNFVKATGTTTSETIDTGLSSIEFFEIHYVSSTSVTNGLVQGAYYGNNDTLFFTYANGSSTIFTNTSLPSVSGGTINLNLSSNNSNWALSNKALHYYWTAFGQA